MSEGPGALTEADKDRIAAVIHEGVERFLSGDPALWNGGNPEEKLNEWIDEQITLSPEAQLFRARTRQADHRRRRRARPRSRYRSNRPR
jgi:hypothetical protein